MQELQQKGYDFFACKDFIETKGLISLSVDLLQRNMGTINYVNPLKPQQPIMQQQINYGYNPNVGQPVMIQPPTGMGV